MSAPRDLKLLTNLRPITVSAREHYALLDALDVGCVVVSDDRRVAYVNQWMCKRSGLDADLVVGQPLLEAFPELTGSAVERAVEDALSSGFSALLSQRLHRAPFALYTRPGRRDAARIAQQVTAKTIDGHNGGVACLVQIVDVTSQVVREDKLREHVLTSVAQRDMLRTLTEMQDEFIIKLGQKSDARPHFTRLLRQLMELLGSTAALLGEVDHYAIPGPALTELAQVVEGTGAEARARESACHCLGPILGEVLRSGELALVEFDALDACGADALERVLVLPLHQGGRTVGVLAIGGVAAGVDSRWSPFIEPLRATIAHLIRAYQADMTRHEAEATLRSSERSYRAVFESSADAIVTCNMDGVILSVNPATEAMFGYTRSELLGREVSILMPEEMAMRHQAVLTSSRDRLKSTTLDAGRDLLGVRKDGTQFPVAIMLSGLQFDGKAAVMGVIRDITDRLRVDQLKREFISTVSHELRTPLTAIKGSLGLLKSGVFESITGKPKELVTIAYDNSDRLVRIVNDLLDIEKIASGKMDFVERDHELASLLQESIVANTAYGANLGVTFELGEVPAHAAVFVDRDRIMQVMANLLSNAAKFSPSGGNVEVHIESRSQAYTISVLDRGPGVPLNFRERLFSKFSQADGSDTRRQGGTGLGLAICKAIVEHHHGQIGYAEREGGGSSFWFTLPCSAAAMRAIARGPGAR